MKNEFIFYSRISRLFKCIQCIYRFKNWLKLNVLRERSTPNRKIKNLPSWFTLSRIRGIGSFHVVVLQRTARKCTKTSNARAELLFCSLSLLFGDVLVAVAVVVCLSSLM